MKKAARIIGCVITLFLTVGLLFYVTDLTERKASDNKYHDFFRDRDYDVLFFGTSHVINGVFPMELWKEYGITSFNCGGTSNELATTYWIMENALDYATPEVVVIDGLHLSSDRKYATPARVHFSLDAFPLSLTKIRAIWDLTDHPGEAAGTEAENAEKDNQKETRLELLWDFSVYHSRWKELTEGDFSPSPSREKGADFRIAVAEGKLEKIDPELKTEPGHTGETYLRRMIETCQKRGIGVVLTYLPFPASVDEQKEANRLYDIAKEYGIPYINFLDRDGIIDYRSDLYDSYSHVNASGARKITSCFGEQLKQLFRLPDRRNEPEYSYWERDYEAYEALKNENLRKQENLGNYLMLLSGDDTDTMIYVQNKDIFRNGLMSVLLENLGIDPGDLGEDTDFILIRGRNKEAAVLNGFTEDGKTEKTKVGNASVSRSGGKGKKKGKAITLAVDGWESMTVEENSPQGIQVNVYRHGVLVDSVNYVYTVNPATNGISISSVIR